MKGRAIAVALILTVLSSGVYSRDYAAQPQQPLPPLARGEHFYIYSLSGFTQVSPMRSSTVVDPGLTILCVSRTTGDLRVLASTGTVAVNTVRQSFGESRVIGLLVSGDYLFLASWLASSFDRPPSLILEKKVPAVKPPVLQQYNLEVFDLKTGKTISRAVLNLHGPKAKVPEATPPETTEKGVLSENKGKVTFFGAQFAIDEGKLKWTDAPSSQTATSASRPATD